MNFGNNKLMVAVLAGGLGHEREVSIESGKCASKALKNAGIKTIIADVSPGELGVLEDSDVDVFFLALHGEFGEDGQLQQILEQKSLLYTGSRSAASRLAFDKIASKEAFAKAGVNVPKGFEFDGESDAKQLEKRLRELGDKYVIKPAKQGSSVGVSIVDNRREAVRAAEKCLAEFGECMIEEFIAGREITVGIVDGQPLPIVEIKTETGFYNYHAKYTDERTEYLFDTIDDRKLEAKIKGAAVDCFNVLGCEQLGRVDFILNDDGDFYALEVNTIPGFTDHSLLPMAGAKAGFSMSELCVKIVEMAAENNKKLIPGK